MFALVSAILIAGVGLTPEPIDPKATALLEQIRTANADLSSLAGEFTQRNRLKLFKQELKSEGVFYFKPPKQVRWEYKSPDPSTMVMDGSKAMLSSPGEAAHVFDLEKDPAMRAVFDQIAMWLAPTAGPDVTKFYVVKAAEGPAPALLLTPQAGSPVEKAFQKIELHFEPKSMLLKSIRLIEKNGDEKEIVFAKLKRNGKLPEAAFKP